MSRLACFAVVLAVSGCAGEDDGRPAPAPPATGVVPRADDCAVAAEYEFQPILTFEGEVRPLAGGVMGTISTTCDASLGAPSCRFYVNHDTEASFDDTDTIVPAGCPPGIVTTTNPRQGSSQLNGVAVEGGLCGTESYAFHYTASNLAVCFNAATGRRGWGGSIDIELAPDADDPPLDMSEWDGVSLWVRSGSATALRAISLLVSDYYTQGGSFEDPRTGETVSCDAVGVDVADSTKCDAFGVAITLPSEWSFVTIPFGALRQKGFGVPAPLGELDPAQLLRIQLSISSGDWDFWVDELAFYRVPR